MKLQTPLLILFLSLAIPRLASADLETLRETCCTDHLAECYACRRSVTVEQYCNTSGTLSGVPGCTDAITARPLMTSARPIMTPPAIAAANDTQSHEGCAMSYMGKCSAFLPTDKPDNLIEEVGHIESVQVCQHICKDLYTDWCTWFIYDRTTNDCKIFSGSIDSFREDCQELGYQKEPSTEHCDVVYEPEEKNSCYNFREDYCRYDGSLLDTLEKIETLSLCQTACTFINNCTYFQYDKQEKICKLHTDLVATRVCDMVHGTPEPDFQTCLDNGNVPWDAEHGNDECQDDKPGLLTYAKSLNMTAEFLADLNCAQVSDQCGAGCAGEGAGAEGGKICANMGNHCKMSCELC